MRRGLVRSRGHWRVRRLRWAAAACGLAVTAGILVGTSGVLADLAPTGAQAVRVHLAYRCRFPTGLIPADVTVTGSFPSAAVAAQPIKLSGLRIAMALPRTAAASLRKLGATAVAGRDVLTVAVAGNAGTNTALWSGRAPEPVALPASGRLHLAFSEIAPPVSAGAPGAVTLTAGGLTAALAFHTANAAAGHPVTVTVACAPITGAGTKFATIPVTGARPRPGHPGGGRHTTAAPHGGGTLRGCAELLTRHDFPGQVLGCAHLLGYADVRKLQEAALVGPAPDGAPSAAFLHADSYASDIGCVPREPALAACTAHHGTIHVYTCTIAQLDYRGQLAFPPARVTFLNFNFVPVTAVMELSETTWPASDPPLENRKCYRGFTISKPVRLKSPVVTVFTDLNDSAAAKFPVLNISATYLRIHIAQVAVNGVPLDVGPDCGTDQPVKAVLTGRGHNGPPPTGYTLDLGGPLTGDVTIPPFRHCGAGENLDPLFDAAISGPGNFQLMTQGTLCTPQQGGKPGCPPTVPRPRRHV